MREAFFSNIYLFGCTGSSLLARGIFSCGMWDLFSWGMRDLVPWPGMKPGPPALGVWSLNHWTTREVPRQALFLPILLMIMEGVGHLKAVSRDENKEDFSLLYSTVWLPVSDALGSLQKLPGLSFMNLYKDWASSVSDSFLLRFRPFVDRVA